MAKKINKEDLFDNYFVTANSAISTFETVFHIDGVWSEIFGVDASEQYGFSSPSVEQIARDHIRASGAWEKLSWLYDYAVYGIVRQHPEDIVIGGAEVLSYITTEMEAPSIEWNHITAQGDGRYALDSGESILLEKLALLANIDVRTVRNAISAGELVAEKGEGLILIENASARNWISGRRGFKPTVFLDEKLDELKEIANPGEFGAFLAAQRKKIGLDSNEKKLTAFHPGADARVLLEIENGVFRLPIDTVFPIADFYQLDRSEFLACVMRVFFSEQLFALRETIKAQ